MRRSVLFLSLCLAVILCIGLLAGPALAAAPEAHHMGFQYFQRGGFFFITYLDGNVKCDAPGSYVGKANAKNEATGELLYVARIKGTCTGSFVSWTVGSEREALAGVTCSDFIRWGGQIRFSDGTQRFIGAPAPFPVSVLC